MQRSWPGYVTPLVAAVLTLLLVWAQETAIQAAALSEETVSPALMLAGFLGLVAPFAVPALWGGAILTCRPMILGPAAAVAWLVAGLGIAPGLVVWPLASFVAAGLAAGMALGFRFRLDMALLVVTAALAPFFIWSIQEEPLDEQYTVMTEQYIEARREMLEGTADPKQIELTLETERRQHEQVAAMAMKILPAMFGLAIVGLAGILLATVWLAARLLGIKTAAIPLPPFGKWRLPFYLVWALVAGLGMFITRIPLVSAVGLNIALAVAIVLSIQGAAVQWELTGRNMGMLPRVVFLLVAGFLFLPLVGLGLADQWLDFRKLEASDEEDSPEDSNGAGTNAPDDDAGKPGNGEQ